MTTAMLRTTAINLEVLCDRADCDRFAGPLYVQMSSGEYDLCSVLGLDGLDLDAWRAGHRTARKRADRCARLGYRFERIERADHADDIYEINTSLDWRQGRPMSAGYRERPEYYPVDYPCERHMVRAYGVLQDDTVYAYLWLYRCGELALVSSLLGHGERLKDDVMWLLMQGVIEAEAPHGGSLVYNRHDSGTDGLRYFKERIGFREREVRWVA